MPMTSRDVPDEIRLTTTMKATSSTQNPATIAAVPRQGAGRGGERTDAAPVPRDRAAVRHPIAVACDRVVDAPRVGDPARAQVSMPWDHDGLVHTADIHDLEARRELDAVVLVGRHAARRIEIAAERRERIAHVVMDVEHVVAVVGHRLQS